MNTIQTVTVNDTNISIKEYNGKRVVTFKDIDACHNRPEGTAGRNFRTNKQHLIEGEDYFSVELTTDEIRRQFGAGKNAGKTMYVVTESGYLMLVKSFTDDLAWQVQRQLVNTYFRKTEESNTKLLELQIKQERARAMYLNAVARLVKATGKQYEDLGLSPIAVDTMKVKAAEKATGADLGNYLPPTDKTYSATDIAKEIGCSANKIGKIANAHGLKSEEYGVYVMDKSRYSSKEMPNFRYNEKGRQKLREIFGLPA